MAVHFTEKLDGLHSILFLPSSALMNLVVLSPRSCLATNEPISLSFLTLPMVSW